MSCRMRLRFGWPMKRFSAACEIERIRSISTIYCRCCVFMLSSTYHALLYESKYNSLMIFLQGFSGIL